MDEKAKKVDFYLIAILIVGISVFIAEAYFVSKIIYVGNLDLQLYTNAAENLIAGNGFKLDFINEYFIKFQSITHPEEYGFPGVSIVIAPFIWLFGKSAFTAKLPSMLIGTILFPLLIYFLGKEFFDRKIGFLAGVSMIFYPAVFKLSFEGERDVMFAFFLALGIYFFYMGLKEKKYFYLMGAVLGFSFLIRQVALIIFPIIILAYYLIEKKISREFLIGLILSAAVMSPWLIGNYLVFGNPIFSVNQYVVWIDRYVEHYEQYMFAVYWNGGVRELPSALWVFNQPFGKSFYFMRVLSTFTAELLSFFFLSILSFIGIVLNSAKRLGNRVKLWIVFLIVLAFLLDLPLLPAFAKFPLLYIGYTLKDVAIIVLRALPYIGIVLTALFLFAKESKRNAVFILLWSTFAAFFAFYWLFEKRYFLPVIPFLLIFSWVGARSILEKLLENFPNFQRFKINIDKTLAIILIIFILISLPYTFGKFLDEKGKFPYRDGEQEKQTLYMAQKINSITEKDAVLMACDLGVFNFYTGRKTVEMPSDNLQNTLGIVKIYNVSHINFMGCQTRFVDKGFLKIITGSYPPPSGYEFNLYEIRPREAGERVEIEVITH
ncbi:TPA: glycosyltransferase family 39 protein [archaeon]|uniref:Glycosyltransferase family 39 protein n=1 Tax=Candidatus Naiadarchaeum limnaeum TaxID=2756139 RepID=A0A832V2Z8_9ARCH|nr:glycosyltransferase family 39 protein [Candidatus Naiadarchaeum limnaeum]